MNDLFYESSTIYQGNTVLIIDAKYYSHTTQTQFDNHTIHSNNLYQIFTYVKNRDYDFKEEEHKVSGMFYMQKQMKKYNLIMYIKCMETRLPLRH